MSSVSSSMRVPAVTGFCVLCAHYLCGYWLLLDFASYVSSTYVGTGCCWTLRPMCLVPMWVLVVTGLFSSVSSRYVSTGCCWTSRLLCPADMCVTFAWTLCILCLVDV